MSISLLVPTDFSDNAHSAFLYALDFAKAVKGTVVVLHVYDKPSVEGSGLHSTLDDFIKIIKEEAIANLDKYKHTVSENNDLTDLDIKFDLVGGHVATSIRRYAHRHDIDFVVMGTQGRSASEAFFLGNVSAETMEYLDVPVLTIPPRFASDKDISSIVFATDYKEDSYKALNWLRHFKEFGKMNISTVHIGSGSEADATLWKENFKDFIVDHTVVNDGDFVTGMKAFLKDNPTDMVALTLTRKNFLYKLFNKQRAEKIVYEKTTPVLAIPDKIWKD